MRKAMLIPIWVMMLIVSFFSSCSKGGDSKNVDGYYIRFKVDGMQKEYRNAVIADMPDTALSGMFGMLVTGLESLDISTHQMSVGVFDYTGQPITVGRDYRMNHDPSFNIEQLAYLTYNEAGDAHSTSVAIEDQDDGFESATIRVTEITDTYVKGTFSGKILEDLSSPDVRSNITDGEFYARRIKSGSSYPDTVGGGSSTPNTDYVEFSIDGRDIRIDEATSPYTSNFASFNSSGTPTLYQCLIGAISNVLAVPFYNLTVSFRDFSPIEGKTYTFNSSMNSTLWLSSTFTLQCKETSGGNYFYYMKVSGLSSPTTITINFSKFSQTKGETIEGTFSATGLIKTNQLAVELANNLSLTNGEFRLTVN